MSILRLQHTRSDGEVDTYHLKSVRRYHIGRGSNCEVRILDLKMSRQHCAIERQGGEWLLHDLGSTNGIKLDGSRVQGSAILCPGGVIKAGNTQLEVADIDRGDEHAANEMTPVRQEALPARESSDELPVRVQPQDEDVSFEPQSGTRNPSSGALQAYGRRPPSDEFDLSDEVRTLAPATPRPEPTPRPRRSGVQPVRIQPEVATADESVTADDLIELAGDPAQLEPPVPEAAAEATSPDDQLQLAAEPATATSPEPERDDVIQLDAEPPAAARPERDDLIHLDAEPPAAARPEPEPERDDVIQLVAEPPAAARPEPEPEADDALQLVEEATPGPVAVAAEQAVAPPAPAPAEPTPAASSDSQPVKPVTIRVGTSRPAVNDSSSSLYINVMGRRIGPLSRSEAREIKARELKGTLTDEDLAKYPGA